MTSSVQALREPPFEVAKMLAREHRKNDPDIQAIYYADDPNNREIRLVEVSSSVGSTGAVLPFRFTARPDLGVPYPSVVVLLSPEEWDALLTGELKLPTSWGTATSQLRKVP